MTINSQTQIFTGNKMEGSQKKKVKLIFLFNMNKIKCFIYSLRPNSMYLVSLNGFVYSCAIHYKLGQPDSAFCVMEPY